MKDFLEYDTMIAQYYGNMSNHILPLSSWEFYGEHHTQLERFKEDLTAIKKITKDWNFERDYNKEFLEKESVIVITNPNLTIVYASQNIQKLNGYSSDEVIGNSPKMFQGKDTCIKTAALVRTAVQERKPFKVSILNYRKDNTPYTCIIKGFPVHNKKGKLVNYIAFEKAA